MTKREAGALKTRIERELPDTAKASTRVMVMMPIFTTDCFIKVHNEDREVITYYDTDEYSLPELCELL